MAHSRRLAFLGVALCMTSLSVFSPVLAQPTPSSRMLPRLLGAANAEVEAKGKGTAAKHHPGKKHAVVAKKKGPGFPMPTIKCSTFTQNPPYKSSVCTVYSTAKVPICVKLACLPMPSGPCPTGQQALDNRECAWAVNQDCSSPAPIQPLGSWGWGLMFSGDQPGSYRILNASVSADGATCPTPQ